jgi:signal transduction histidine kinase
MLLVLLVALAAAQLPLVWSQSRRARAEARDREQLARAAERALQDERGRIATELHEGVVQDLAGAAYELHAAATLPAASEDDLRRALGHGADVCRRTMTRMRELLVDLRAEEHRVQDLRGAMEAIARPLENAGVEVILGVAVDRPLPGDVALLVHRAAREILLDVRRRRDVSLVTLKLAERGAEVTLSVDHNVVRGAGEDRADGPSRRGQRLDSLAAALDARGGALTVDEIPGAGARYTATVPLG